MILCIIIVWKIYCQLQSEGWSINNSLPKDRKLPLLQKEESFVSNLYRDFILKKLYRNYNGVKTINNRLIWHWKMNLLTMTIITKQTLGIIYHIFSKLFINLDL